MIIRDYVVGVLIYVYAYYEKQIAGLLHTGGSGVVHPFFLNLS